MPRRRSQAALAALVLCALARVAPPAPAAETRTPADALFDALGAALPAVKPVWPQQEPAAEGRQHPLDQDLRDVLRPIIKAEQFAAKGQMLKAAAKFQEALDRPGRDMLLHVGGGAYVPAWRYCTARLLTGPGPMLAAYRGSYEPAARKALAAAQAGREAEALRQVVRRYGATASASKALEALASLQLERGRALAASQTLYMRLAIGHRPARVEPQVLAKFALALARARCDGKLMDLAAAVRAHCPKASVEVDGRVVGLSRFVRSLLPASPAARPEGSQGPSVRPAALLWQVPLRARPEPLAAVRRVLRRRPREHLGLALAAPDPALHNGVLYCQAFDVLKAIDPRTGRVLWNVPLGAVVPSPSLVRLNRAPAPSRGGGTVTPAINAAPRAAAVVVSFATAHVETDEFRTRRLVRTGRIDALPSPRSKRGATTLWSVSTRAERPEDSLRLVCSPAAANGIVCVGARRSQNESEAFLIGYDAVTGRRLWRTHVASADWIDPAAMQNLWTDGSRPAVDDGLAYYCTDLGTIAAVDLGGGSIVWLHQYPRKTPVVCNLKTIGGHRTAITAPPNRPIVAGGTIFALPADSQHVLALDAATGAVKWRREREHGDAVALHLLAADKKRVYLSGSAVLCLDAATGALLWRSVLLDSFPVGRGLVTSDRVMVPIEGSIAMIDIRATGRLAEPVRWAKWRRDRVGSGNLMLLDGRLLVARDDSLSVFAGDNWGAVLHERIAREPREPGHHVELGVLFASLRKWPEAVAAFEKARMLQVAREKATVGTEELLAEAYRNFATDLERTGKWPEATRVLSKALALENKAMSRAALLLLRKARALEKSGDVPGALRVLHDVLARFPDAAVRVPDGLFSKMAGLTARASVLAAARVAEIVKRHGPQVYGESEADASAAAKVIGALPDRAAAQAQLRKLAAKWPNSSVAASLGLSEAREAVKEKRFAAASGELLTIERLCHEYDADAVKAVRAELAAAKARQRRRPAPAKAHHLPRVLWRTPLPGTRSYKESAADLAAMAAGRYTGEHLLFTDGKSLRAYNLLDGKLAWDTGTGWLGVRYQAPTTVPPGMPRAALEFLQVLPGHPADKAGAKNGDLLLSFDGHPIRQKNDLIQFCGTTQPGKKVALEVLRGRRRITLSVVIGRRPASSEPSGWSLRVTPQEYIRVVGVEGEHIIADVDLALLWISRMTGRIERRAIIAPYPDSMASLRLLSYYSAAQRAHERLIKRGIRPVMGEGVIVAPTPGGTIECFDMSGRRRWSVDLAASDPSSAKQGLTPAVLKLVVRNGAVAAITVGAGRSIGGGVQGTAPRLLVLDAFTGLTLLSKELSRTRSPEKCELLPAGPNLVIALPAPTKAEAGTLVCYEPSTGKEVWKTGGRDGPAGESFDMILPAGDKIIATLGRTNIVAVGRANGDIAWRVNIGGPVRRLIAAEGKLFVAYDKQAGARAASYAIACVRTSDGKVLWDKVIVRGAHLQPADPIPFAAVSGGRLVLVQHLMTERGKHFSLPRIAVIRTSDGALLGMIGMGGDGRYNVHGGKWALVGRLKDGVIGLITEAGLIGLSFEKE